MDGILALDLWVVVIEVLHSSNNVPPTQKISTPKCKPKGAAGPLLTEGSVTRDEWCNVLCLVKTMNLSMFSHSRFRSVEQATTMSKIIQERKMEGRTCGGKAKVSVFDFSKLEERAIFFIWSRCSQYPGEPAAGFGVSERSPQETAGRTVSKEPRGTAGRTLSKTESKTPKTYSSLERRQPVSTELLETAKAQCPRRCA